MSEESCRALERYTDIPMCETEVVLAQECKLVSALYRILYFKSLIHAA